MEASDDLSISPADIKALLELACEAAHESGDRTNAPLVAYLLGLTYGRSADTNLRDLIATALTAPVPTRNWMRFGSSAPGR